MMVPSARIPPSYLATGLPTFPRTFSPKTSGRTCRLSVTFRARNSTSSPLVSEVYHIVRGLISRKYAAPPGPDSDAPSSPQGGPPSPYTFKMSQMKANELQGGSVKIVDSSTFPVSKTIAAAEVTVNPGAMRELHWHPTQDEWSFFM